MRVLRTRYDMIALLLQTAPKVHHNYAKRIITHNSPQAIIVEFCYAKLPLFFGNPLRLICAPYCILKGTLSTVFPPIISFIKNSVEEKVAKLPAEWCRGVRCYQAKAPQESTIFCISDILATLPCYTRISHNYGHILCKSRIF